MAGYGQFCPVAKASEVVGEKWTVLILRELLLGATRFSDLQRGISRISPTLLVKRLRHLETSGIVVRKRLSGRKGYEYRLTAAGKELAPLVEVLAIWGMRWARDQLTDDELDVEFLMQELRRRLDTERLPDGQTVVCMIFDDLSEHDTWWLLVDGGEVDLCTEDPGKEVDVYVSSKVRTMVEVWEGDIGLREALREGSVEAHGPRHLVRTLPDWLGVCPYKDVPRGDPKLKREVAGSTSHAREP